MKHETAMTGVTYLSRWTSLIMSER